MGTRVFIRIARRRERPNKGSYGANVVLGFRGFGLSYEPASKLTGCYLRDYIGDYFRDS